MYILKFLLKIVVFLLISNSAIGQSNFFTDFENTDFNNLYETGPKYTFAGTVALPIESFGICMFKHNNTNQISYFFNIQSTFITSDVYSGKTADGTGVEQKIIETTSTVFNIGLGHAYSLQSLIFANVGTVYHTNSFTSEVGNTHLYKNVPEGMNLNLGFGYMYVGNSNFTYIFSFQSFNRSILFGLGYTL